MKRFWVVLIVLLVVAGAGYWALAKKNAQKSKVAPPKQVTLERGDISKFVTASGNVVSNLDVEIKCKASGEIISLPFDIGASVNKGDLIVQLDPVDMERNLQLSKIALDQSQARALKAQENLANSQRTLETSRKQAQIDLASAQAQADQAQTKSDNTKKLFDQGFASKDEVDAAVTALASAKAQLESAKNKFRQLDDQAAAIEMVKKDVALAAADVKSAQIDLDVANQRLEDTKVYAPMNGVVTARLVQVGQIISSGISATTGGTSIMTLSDLSRIFVDAAVDESNIGEVAMNQPVKVSVDAFPKEVFDGEVVRMAKSGDNISNVVTFQVRIEILSSNKSLLMPQMTADSKIITVQKKGVMVIPLAAVTVGHTKSTVEVLGPNGQPEVKEVVTGVDDGNNIEIISGLAENDIVLMKDQSASSPWSGQGGNNQRRPGPPLGMMGPPH